ncbi:MAG: DUF1338 domain-containing protein [Candidatus Omnitrophota bacterium]|nr:DUF1338 domain-containing protein [Candidatus Omnitrophota bacterium]
MKTLTDLLEWLWNDYAAMNSQAGAIHRALEARGEKVINDHVAFRTFDLPEVRIEALAAPFLRCGYELRGGPYLFKEKKLFARHYAHPDTNKPKIFISALKVGEFSNELQRIVRDLVTQLPAGFSDGDDFLIAGAPWQPVSWDTYSKLLAESEYAAWMAAFGFRVNHFTVFFNALTTFKTLPELNTFIKGLGYALNASGGEIKGSPEVFLEQSSTLAHSVVTEFSDRTETIPGCYYEFAKRYVLSDGKLFQGFVAESADKIFESTDSLGSKDKDQK